MVFLDIPQPEEQPEFIQTSIPLKKLTLVASIAGALQYGWALQLSLLTPYTQRLGLSHYLASFIWLCGPVSGLIVQPIVGHLSDRCTSIFGRRRPFLVAGAALLSVGVLLIGFSADIGQALGDSLAEGSTKHRACLVLVLGFWLLDISNNMIQSPCRALLADISGDNESMVTIGNALYAFFMAVGSVVGYGLGAYDQIYRIMPFTKTEACNLYCASLKTCFILSILFTTLVIIAVCFFIKEERFDPCILDYGEERFYVEEKEKRPSLFMQISVAVRSQSRAMWMLYIVTALNWVGCFPFQLYDTEWMGKEVFGGKAVGTSLETMLYDRGVRAGSLGLMLYVVTMGVVSLFMGPLMRILGSVRRLWGMGNVTLAMCMVLTVVITKMAEDARKAAIVTRGMSLVQPPAGVQVSCFALFAALGIPQAVTYSIPFALASIYSKDSGAGQGLAVGLLNLAIVIPQMGVALVTGPLDSLFGGSNLPAFVLGAVAATVGGVSAIKLLSVE